MKLNILYLFFFATYSVCAQTGEEILKKAAAAYAAAEPLQFGTTYNLYKQHKDTRVHDSYKGTYYKNGNNDLYIKINNTEYLVTKNVNAKISHEEKAILLTKTQSMTGKEYDLTGLLSEFRKGTVNDKSGYWEIVLLAKPVTTQPYSKIIVHIGKDYRIQKEIFYYSTPMNFSNDYRNPEMRSPRLEIIFGKHSAGDIPEELFDASRYFTLTGNKVALAAKYRNYELVDHR